MITASHLPYQRNGFKFFTAEGGLEKADIKDVLFHAAQAAAAAGVPPDNEFLGTAYVMTMALGIPAGLKRQVSSENLKLHISPHSFSRSRQLLTASAFLVPC
jgi:hypothetical protein